MQNNTIFKKFILIFMYFLEERITTKGDIIQLTVSEVDFYLVSVNLFDFSNIIAFKEVNPIKIEIMDLRFKQNTSNNFGKLIQNGFQLPSYWVDTISINDQTIAVSFPNPSTVAKYYQVNLVDGSIQDHPSKPQINAIDRDYHWYSVAKSSEEKNLVAFFSYSNIYLDYQIGSNIRFKKISQDGTTFRYYISPKFQPKIESNSLFFVSDNGLFRFDTSVMISSKVSGEVRKIERQDMDFNSFDPKKIMLNVESRKLLYLNIGSFFFRKNRVLSWVV